MARLVIRPRARSDLLDVGEYGTPLWGRDAAADYVASFDSAFGLLVRHPKAGRERDDLDPGLRSWRHRSHIIYYRVAQDRVIVSRILHSAADPSSVTA